MLAYYQSHLIAIEIFPGDIDTFRFNSITRKDCVSFVNHQDSIAFIASIGDMTTTPPINNGLACNFKVA